MRLHELSITAFGPFVDTVHVDLDELAAVGLFLLTGDTGAGKSSILDAVCFALYGEVPGDRHGARHLRSDHASPEAEPLVVLRLSIGERTFRFTRSPAWDRPRRRGDGTRRIQAHVVVEEQRGGAWLALTNRLDEAGQLVTGLLGMTCTQFNQVALLPQGRFQTFLRASSAERHAVLQRLFRTRRFEDVERWLADRRLALHRRSQTLHDRCSGVVARLQEAAGVSLPAGWDVHDLEPNVEDATLATWTTGLHEGAAAAVGLHGAGLDAATALLADRRVALDRARTGADARRRGERAKQALEALDATRDEESVLRSRLDAHRRGAPVVPVARRATRATTAATETGREAEEQLALVADLLEDRLRPSDLDHLSDVAARRREARAVAESWLPRERELQESRSRARALATDVARLRSTLESAARELDDLGEHRETLTGALEETVIVAERRGADTAATEAAATGLAAAQQVELLTQRLAETRIRLAVATKSSQDLRESYLDLREQRISGMAAELAVGLAVGCSCPVCGSSDHPALAAATQQVSRADEDAARDRYESADFERQAVKERETAFRTQLDGARRLSQDEPVDHWSAEHEAAAAHLEVSTAAARSLPRLRADLASLDERAHRAGDTSTSTTVSLEERSRELEETTARRDDLDEELRVLLTDHPGTTTVLDLVTSHTDAVRRLERAHQVLTRQHHASLELTRATEAAEESASAAGFDDVAAALAAVLPEATADQLATRLDERRAATAAAVQVLDQDDVGRALAEPAVDLTALVHDVSAASTARDRVHAEHQRAVIRVDRLGALAAELDTLLADWEPVRREHALTAGLTSLVEGKSADNQLKMRLSAYVLGERLRQVVAAANERLVTMTDERFTLEQVDEKGAGEQRGGLSLRVRDEWSGKRRDPATLSGGETFLVSLALALGLADTVSHEAGGTQLDTLFIDEGFGALDATTLDGVMDTLDSLRDGGRVVGLVSHVAELRNRVTSQLEVRKARRGSTVHALLVDG